jgi:transposase-like protein
MLGHGTKFGRKKEQAIVALLSHRTIEEAARAIEIVPNTLLRWMKEPEFDTAYRAAKRAAFGQSIARLHYLSSAAVTTLGKVMLEPGTPPATRVRAADSILDHTTKAIEIEGLEARLTELERAAEGTTGRRSGL